MLASLITSVSAVDTCSKCGNMEVPYPLSTNDDCGDSRYRVYCNNDILQFLSSEGFYYKIQSIDPSAHTLIISPPTIASDICYSADLKVGGLRLTESSPFNISTHNTVMLLNCSESILLSPLNCSSNSLCRQFEDKVKEGNVCKNTLCCTFLKDASLTAHRIRVRVGGCSAYTCVVNMNSGNSPTSWNYGIELQWSSPN
ncbi:hypothetical protein IFM89_021454 [Coptis chinensis]|uniref:Wall-associated receptor kinase galacturonan-binding domain-containing protein n=1 Tax=Coptis chinensis TaxID=261450 RepID=A0A835LV15_9MAGN|nr:hypothetical protein IFM89_021454 [Coptis chinensis]